MAGSQEDSAEKEHEPSPRRLDEARRKGDVAKSADLMTAASYFGLYLAGAAGAPIFFFAATSALTFLDQAPALAVTSGAALSSRIGGLLWTMVVPVLGLLLVPGIASLLSVIAQRALVFAPTKLQPKLSRISPVANARQKFGPEGLFEFGKNSLKLLIIGTALGLFFGHNREQIIAMSALEAGQGVELLLHLLGMFLLAAALLTGVFGVLDLLWQRHALTRRNRMSRQELLDEMKDSEGDPQAKAERKVRGQDMAMNQMLAEVPTASVIIVNPTHFAVALRWRKGQGSAPIVVAKGVDEIALKIRSTAKAAGVPIHSDPPTARAIHATTQLGEPISRDHYKAVAAAIRFADRIRQRNRGAGA